MSKIIKFPETTKVKTYRVIYAIDVDAEHPEDAAMQAALTMKRKLNGQTIFPLILGVSLVGSLGVTKQVEVKAEDILQREEEEH